MANLNHAGDKPDLAHEEHIHDHDLAMEKVDTAEAMHMMALTEEEQALALKLRRKIDLLIMPLVVLVYLMNYIDR